jgi:hypothetical protein
MDNHDSSPEVTNCTFYGNSVSAMNSNFGSFPTVANCIFWGNGIYTGVQIDSAEIPMVIYSDVEGGCTVSSGCTQEDSGNIDADPLFIDPTGGDLRLQAGSPCIDTGIGIPVPYDEFDLDGDGDTDEKIPFDLDGNPRIVGDAVDMGAYELQ